MTGLLIHDDAAEVVGDLELLVPSEGAGVDAVDDGAAVGPVLGHGDPDVCAVEVNAARVVHVALTESDVLLEVAGLIHDKQVADSLARCAIVATLWGRVLHGGFENLDCRQEDVVRREGDAFCVERGEVELQLARELPVGIAVDTVEVIGEGCVAGVVVAGSSGIRGGCATNGQRSDDGCDHGCEDAAGASCAHGVPFKSWSAVKLGAGGELRASMSDLATERGVAVGWAVKGFRIARVCQ